MPEDTKSEFPRDFLWGASTASYQVEGGNHNDWSEWELKVASQQAKNAKEHLAGIPAWQEIKAQAESPDNYISGKGIDHYNRYKEDFDLLKQLNFNSFRFGIEWSRIEPEEGKWNEEAIAHYKNYIAELKKRHIQPVINLWHYSLPIWFAEKGAFAKHSNIKYFERFVKKIAYDLIVPCDIVITINEPNVYATFSYLLGEYPPQEKSLVKFCFVYWNLAIAHRRTYKILKKIDPSLHIGVASQLANIQAKHPHNEIDEMTTRFMRWAWNWWFLRRTRREQDFIGFNYYFTDYYSGWGEREDPKLPLNDLGWYMEPEGLYPLLLSTWARYKKPILITENGVADMHDEYRRWWIEETVIAMERALSEGVQIKGYFHWSLLDNFEWAYGWWPRFGLVAVDRKHGMKRTVRQSSKWFADFIARQVK